MSPHDQLRDWVRRQREFGRLVRAIHPRLHAGRQTTNDWMNGRAVPQAWHKMILQEVVGNPFEAWPKAGHTGRPRKQPQGAAS